MVSYSSVCPALGLLLALSAFCSAQQAATQNPVAVAEAQNKYSKQMYECLQKEGGSMKTCFVEVVSVVRLPMLRGDPEVNLPSSIPFKIASLPMDVKSNSVELKGTITDLVIDGVENLNLTSVTPIEGTNKAAGTVHFSNMKATGSYEFTGQVLVLPLNGKGPFNFTVEGLSANVTMTFVREGATGFKITDMDLTIGMDGGSIYLAGLLGDDSVGGAVNNLLNENFKLLAPEFNPIYKGAVFGILRQLVSTLLVGIPLEEFTKAGMKI